MDKLILGYVTNRALESVTQEDANRLTHINLAFGKVKDGLLSMHELTHIDEVARIRSLNPKLKFVLSVGGWGAGGFSLMARTAAGREAFAASCLKEVEKYNLDDYQATNLIYSKGLNIYSTHDSQAQKAINSPDRIPFGFRWSE